MKFTIQKLSRYVLTTVLQKLLRLEKLVLLAEW